MLRSKHEGCNGFADAGCERKVGLEYASCWPARIGRRDLQHVVHVRHVKPGGVGPDSSKQRRVLCADLRSWPPENESAPAASGPAAPCRIDSPKRIA